LQPAVILQYRQYRETSMLLDMFTRDYGIVSAIAKGVRKEKSRLAGILQPFSLLTVSYLDKNELKVLIQAEFVNGFPLKRIALYCGFYVNELIQKMLHRSDPHPELFIRYLKCLTDLAMEASIEETLRYFELDLLAETGYGADLDMDYQTKTCVQSHLRYNFTYQFGVKADEEGIVTGLTLQKLTANQTLNDTSLYEAKQLLRKMLDCSLQGKTLKSREVLAKIIKHL